VIVAKNPRANKQGQKREKKEFSEELLNLARVTRVVKGGRRMRFKATVAIGNKKGKVGLGTGKSSEVATAVQKAVAAAKKSLIDIPLTETFSVPHSVKLKYKAARMLVMPASEGTGVKAGGVMRKIFELAGIHNVFGKRFGTTTPLVNAQATMKMLERIKTPKKAAPVVVAETVLEEESK